MSDESQRPIIVKRVKKAAHGAHGGAWKIAYADFVTAMMAFFLLMWLLGSTTRADLQGISEFFRTPLRVSLMGGSGAGDTTSIVKGGGTDLLRADGQEKHGDSTSGRKVADLKQAEQEMARQDKKVLSELKAKIEAAIAASPTLSQFKDQLLIDITTEGLRIQIIDEKNRPMFAIGSAQLQPYTRQILHEIGKVLNDVPNRISLSGHTDATPYSGGEGGYSNWDLSADRSNAVRRELILGGMDDKRIARVVGLSSSVMLDTTDPYSPTNRRVSIIVMNKKAEEAAAHDGGTIEVTDPASVTDPAAAGDPAQVHATTGVGKSADAPVEAPDAGSGKH